VVNAEGSPTLSRLWARLHGAVAQERSTRRKRENVALTLAVLGELASRLRDANPEAPWVSELLDEQREQHQLGHRTLLELGRVREHHLPGWESRSLVDLRTGELFREEGAPGSDSLTRGPPGRTVTCNFGKVLVGMSPPRIRVLQYEYRPAASSDDLARAVEHASFQLPHYDDPNLLAAQRLPVFLRPERLEPHGTSAAWAELEDTRIALVENGQAGLCKALWEAKQTGKVRALLGALLIEPDGVALWPWSAIVSNQQYRLVPLAT
jgi:hypothetical protein